MNIELTLSPQQASTPTLYTPIALARAKVSAEQVRAINVIRRSIDARGAKVKVVLALEVILNSDAETPKTEYRWGDVAQGKRVVIVGCGPAGLFAALRLIELGCKPIVIERGASVSQRKRDIAIINRNGDLNCESNYCFGEGGAGTFSDGKLFTRSKKRGNSKRILEIFNIHGAKDEILYQAHPHIGTDKLPQVIAAMRETILNSGGEIHFDTKVVDITLKGDKVTSLVTAIGNKIEGESFILATGHSARDVYQMLHNAGVELEAKSFAMGVRIEHPQHIIDSIQYNQPSRGEFLPSASYSLVTQVAGRGVYSFCMCPGGFIVPASTSLGESVVNGMSPSERNSKFANSGMVTEVRESDYAHLTKKFGALAGVEFQKQFEQSAYSAGGGAQVVPGQRLTDFVRRKASTSAPKTSYHPGVECGNMHEWMPSFISQSLRDGLDHFGRRLKGFYTEESLLLGVESRTSSPVRIPRDKESLAHIKYTNLYPCGEGAGYAGGIVSSGVDGERVAEKIAETI